MPRTRPPKSSTLPTLLSQSSPGLQSDLPQAPPTRALPGRALPICMHPLPPLPAAAVSIRAREMVASGSSLAEVLSAGQWRSSAFMLYLDKSEIEEDAVFAALDALSDGE